MQGTRVTPPELAGALMDYLGCPCRYFEPMADDAPLLDAYRDASERGGREGFLPVLVAVSERLWETLVRNADGDGGREGYGFDAERVAAYRGEMLGAPLKKGSEVAAVMLYIRQREAAEDKLD